MEDGLPETVNSLEAVRHLLASNKKELPTNFELTEGLISPILLHSVKFYLLLIKQTKG